MGHAGQIIAILGVVLVGPVRADEVAGALALLGGGGRPQPVMEEVAERAGGRSAVILVVSLAHPRAEEEGRQLALELTRAGAGAAEELTWGEGSGDDWEALRRIEAASGVFLAGGDQDQLATALRGTRILDAIRALHERGGVVAGESAGATVLGSLMILGATSRGEDGDRTPREIRAGATRYARGLGLLPASIVDQHFLHRRRQNRLLTALLEHPELMQPPLAVRDDIAILGRPPEKILELFSND